MESGLMFHEDGGSISLETESVETRYESFMRISTMKCHSGEIDPIDKHTFIIENLYLRLSERFEYGISVIILLVIPIREEDSERCSYMVEFTDDCRVVYLGSIEKVSRDDDDLSSESINFFHESPRSAGSMDISIVGICDHDDLFPMPCMRFR